MSDLHSQECWEAKLQQWLLSGKSARSWCKENQVVYTTFMRWRNRLRYGKKQNANYASQKNALNPSSTAHFIELKNPPKIYPGIYLECEGVQIHLSQEFDIALLKKCLNVLRGATC